MPTPPVSDETHAELVRRYHDAHATALAADGLFCAALLKEYGKKPRAADMRYRTTELPAHVRVFSDAYGAAAGNAHKAWEAMHNYEMVLFRERNGITKETA